MTVVIDASVLVAALVDSGRETRWAEDAIAGDDLASPELALVEATNTLRRLELSGHISRFEATSAHADLLKLDLVLFPFAPFAERVWALRANLTSYDAWYVALAEALDCRLLTLDRKLSAASGLMCPKWSLRRDFLYLILKRGCTCKNSPVHVAG